MVKLKGTEKQIKWADDIRTKAIEKILDSNYKYKEKIADDLANFDNAEAIISKRETYENDEEFNNYMERINKRLEKRNS